MKYKLKTFKSEFLISEEDFKKIITAPTDLVLLEGEVLINRKTIDSCGPYQPFIPAFEPKKEIKWIEGKDHRGTTVMKQIKNEGISY